MLTIALGVFIGMIMTTTLSLAIMLNSKFLKWFVEKYMKVVEDIADSYNN